MTEKAIVTKEQAEALAIVIDGDDISDIFKIHVNDGWCRSEFLTLNELSTEELAKALINGYEVERTPEEKVQEYCERLTDDIATAKQSGGSIHGIDWYSLYRERLGVETTLDTLGIKIEGINA